MKTPLVFTTIVLTVNGVDTTIRVPGVIIESAIADIMRQHGVVKAKYSYCAASSGNVLAFGCILPFDMEAKPC